MSRNQGSKTIYVGNLPVDVRRRDLEDLFHKYGKIVEVDVKVPVRPPGFAFVEFGDSRDAEDAVKGRDGYSYAGSLIRVELAEVALELAMDPSGTRERTISHRVAGTAIWAVEAVLEADAAGATGADGGGGGGGGSISRRTEWRVSITKLPNSASWQDLKDHMRKCGGDVTFSQVFRDNSGTCGVVDFSTKEMMKTAVRKLDDSEFRNPFDRSFIRVKEDDSQGPAAARPESPAGRAARVRALDPVLDRAPILAAAGAGKEKDEDARPAAADPGPARRPAPHPALASKSPRSKSRSKSPRSKSPSKSRSKSPRSKSRSKSPRSKSPSKSRSKSPPAEKRSKSRSKSRDSRSPRRSTSPKDEKMVESSPVPSRENSPKAGVDDPEPEVVAEEDAGVAEEDAAAAEE
eukprot:CAMPEP_0114319700 /NCGR_PEP_ID=MMETSP0059-20121206/25408_1 /TAXON_ID=36894 /ORGANISM="Pyramimonas parkeae, Strain CCMP726" /LENGTH=404 /DNA_ID=CAMNT_0001446779 /DNA_START=250 /DNA_END=1465 /DNA_ORIENTATION=+